MIFNSIMKKIIVIRVCFYFTRELKLLECNISYAIYHMQRYLKISLSRA